MVINQSETPRYLVEEEVRHIQVFTSRVIPGNVARDRVIFATFVYSLPPGRDYLMMRI